MILDKIENIGKYADAVPHSAEIADFLASHDAATLPAGRYDVADGVFVNVLDLTNGENSVYEAHRRYSDLQCVIVGDEYMKRCHISACGEGGEYSEENDCILYKRADRETLCHVFEGEFAFFEPEDAHCPSVCGNTPAVRKLIFKIPIK